MSRKVWLTPNRRDREISPAKSMSIGRKSVDLNSHRLAIDEIQQNILRIGYEISPSFLKDPSQDEFLGLVSLAIQQVLNVSKGVVRIEEATGDLGNSISEKVDILPYEGRLHLCALGNLRFIRYFQLISKHIFNLSDTNHYMLFHPTAYFVQNFSSALIRFLHVKNGVRQIHNQKIAAFSEQQAKYQSLVWEADGLKQDLNLFTEKFTDLTADIENEIHRNDTLTQQKAELNRTNHAMQVKINEANSQIEKNELMYIQLDLDIAAAKNEEEDLLDQIIQSPDKLRARISQAECAARDTKAALDESTEELLSWQKTVALVERTLQNLNHLQTFLSDHVYTTLQVMSDSYPDYSQTVDGRRRIQTDVEVLEAEINSLENAIENAEKKLNSTEIQARQEITNWEKQYEREEKLSDISLMDAQAQKSEATEKLTQIQVVRERIRQSQEEFKSILDRIKQSEKLVDSKMAQYYETVVAQATDKLKSRDLKMSYIEM